MQLKVSPRHKSIEYLDVLIFFLNLMTENYFLLLQHYARATTCTFLGKLLSCILLPFYNLMHFLKLSWKNVMIWVSLVMSFHVKDIKRIFFPH